jgi:probable F420-dependent oxidoreductase
LKICGSGRIRCRRFYRLLAHAQDHRNSVSVYNATTGEEEVLQAPRVSVVIQSWDIRVGTTGEMVLDAARRAEELGLDGIVAGDHVTFHGYGNDGLITLAAVAAVTDTIELKTGVYLLPLRHPVPVALQVAQIDQLSLGRLVLGVGIGGEDPHEFLSCGIDPRTRGARTNESLQIIKRLWTEDNVSFKGRHFQLDDVTLYPKPLRPVPIFVGGRSDAAFVRAGRYGDGYTGIWQSIDRFREAQASIETAAAAAGREPGSIEFGMQFWTGVGSNQAEAKALVSERMEAMYGVPFERFERYTPIGTPRAVAEFIMPYVEAGARHINLVPAQRSPEENVERGAAIREELITLCC